MPVVQDECTEELLPRGLLVINFQIVAEGGHSSYTFLSICAYRIAGLVKGNKVWLRTSISSPPSSMTFTDCLQHAYTQNVCYKWLRKKLTAQAATSDTALA